VSPPVAIDVLAGHSFGEIRSGAAASFEHDPMLFNELYRIHRVIALAWLLQASASLVASYLL